MTLDKKREYTARWREENADRLKAYDKAYRLKNAEARKAAMIVWRANNKVRIKEARAEWHANNRKETNDTAKAWRKRNPDVCAAHIAIRRKRVRTATPLLSVSDRDEMRQMYRVARRVSRETGRAYHIDHEVPLKGRAVSGLHNPANLQLLTATLNLKKGNR